MKDFGLSDSLIVACADLESEPLRFPRVFYHENVGRSLGYLPLNKPFALSFALKKGLISQPFAVIDPDMVMKKPLPNIKGSAAQYSSYLEYGNLCARGYKFDFTGDGWCPAGCVYYFNDCDTNIIDDIFETTLWLKEKYSWGLAEEVDYWQREMVAFSIILSRARANVRFDFEASLNDSRDCCFVHYCNGFQPFFNKRLHNNLRDFSLGSSLPFESIFQIPSANDNILRLKNVANSFLNERDPKLIKI